MLKGLGLLVIGILVLGISMLFSFTPIVWHLTGREDETYPELLFAFYYLPASALLVIDAVTILGFSQKSLGKSIIWGSAWSKIGFLGLLSLGVTNSALSGVSSVTQVLLNTYHIIILPLQLIASCGGLFLMLKLKSKLAENT